jgi:Fe-S oxidoreductase
VHGPKEVHIILLDNGRTKMRERPEFRNALACIRCSACLNACPAFQAVGGHAFGHRYTGPIGLILTAFHHGYENAEGPQSLCMSCNACETVCPAGIELPRMILDLRQEMKAGKPVGAVKSQALRTLTYQDDAQLLLKIGRMAQMPFAREKSVRVPGLTSWRSLPRLPEKGFLERHRPSQVFPANPALPTGAAGRDVTYFPGCISDNLAPETAQAAVDALTGLGAAVTLPEKRQCCGLAHLNSGDEKTARELAKETIAMLERAPGDAVVSTSTSCVTSMVQDYPHLLRHEPEWAARAQALARRIQDFATFVDRVAGLKPGSLDGGEGEGIVVTYHDSCQSTNCLKLGPEQRRLLCEAMGAEVKEMEESSMCCGFGGTFSLDYPRVSARVLKHKLDHIRATGAPVVATDNPGCVLHIRGGLDAAGDQVRVAHLAELLAERLAEIRKSKSSP